MISREKLKRLPHKPGVYLMKDDAGKVLYVGKAVDLRRRVASHIRPRRGGQPCSPAMAPRTEEVDYIVTDTEQEALLLEQNLIKEHWPPYNVSLKDDSSPAHIRLSVDDEYPCMTVTRAVPKDGARYFGPYYSADDARRTIRFLRKIFPLRECSASEFLRRGRPCIKYQIKRCSAPCRGMIGREEYGKLVRRVILFLSGKTGDLLDLLQKEMEKCAEKMNYEKAGELRDGIGAIRRTVERQKIVTLDEADRDVVGIYTEGGSGEAAILFVRGGRLIGRKTIALEGEIGSEPALIRRIMLEHYLRGAFIPPEILLPSFPDERGVLQRHLSERRGGRVALLSPRRGDKRALVRMAASNAEAAFFSRRERDLESEKLLREMQRKFHLAAPPRWVECVDISDIGGSAAVGSVAAFRNGVPWGDGYRRFSIKTVAQSDDCRMIYEVLTRRTRRGLTGWGLPDLFVIDGGRGQLHAALRALSEAGVSATAAIALAKERRREERRVPERVFIEGRANAISLKRGDAITLFLQRLRDEAHRFALDYHRRLRGKRLLTSEIEALEGIGAARVRQLLASFGDMRGVAQAPLGALTRVLRSRVAAKRVYEHFRKQGGRQVVAQFGEH